MQREHPPKSFATTHWSVVLSAKNPDSPESEQAMATLCETYWYPLYAFVRRTGHSPPVAAIFACDSRPLNSSAGAPAPLRIATGVQSSAGSECNPQTQLILPAGKSMRINVTR